MPSFQGSALERTASVAPATHGRKTGGGASRKPRSQAEPGNEWMIRSLVPRLRLGTHCSRGSRHTRTEIQRRSLQKAPFPGGARERVDDTIPRSKAPPWNALQSWLPPHTDGKPEPLSDSMPYARP
ncbi:hypothetical protein Mal15_07150 [Stieleria maiorica]|uniref:Uncharacterized protein n=1 Tax=Stieleria maiorica TaxID=2795974 RepID=A0A5B9MBV5_9BACT|nr:hypothetical protein Mal15_07150 [Stieleria maiorica]